MMKQAKFFTMVLLMAFGAVMQSHIAQARSYNPDLFAQLKWRAIGPLRGGRSRAVDGVPNMPNVFYFGCDDGGVWKSTDYGRTWVPIFDKEPTGSIGAIAVAPSNPNIIYVGSGEGIIRPDGTIGDGMYKSTDGGKTWVHLGLRDSQKISQVIVDPHNPNRLFVAVIGHPYGPNKQRGIFRSTDGGKTFKKVLYKDEYTSGDDVDFDPKNPQIVYATLWQQQQAPWENGSFGGTSGGIFKSIDGGNTWKQLTKGLPKGLTQAAMTVSRSDPNRIYASVATGRKVGLYRSDNAGESWTLLYDDDQRAAARIGGGDLPLLAVDPQNPNIVYSASRMMWRSTDAGKTWTAIHGGLGGDDYQQIWINPNNPNVLEAGSDQGVIVSVNAGKTWSSWYNQPTAAMYKVGIDNTWPYRVCGGQQDSGSACVLSRGNDGELTAHDWHPVGIAEYGGAAPDPLHPNIIYGGKVTRYNRKTGQIQYVSPPRGAKNGRTVRTMPLLFSPLDPHVLYSTSNVVWKTSNGGHSWTQISPDLTRKGKWKDPANVGKYRGTKAAKPTARGVIKALAASPLDENLIWAGTDDGLIQVTWDGGKHWENVTPPQMKPWWTVFSMEASHFDRNTAYAAINTMRLNDMRPHLFRTTDGGKHWTEIDNGIPDGAVSNVIREDPKKKGLLFAGTENQVYVSFDNGDHWQSLRLNMPAISVRDLKIKGDDLVAATHGRGFWILDDITPLRQIDNEVAQSKVTLFRPEVATRVRWGMNPPTAWRMPAMKNPPPGAIIDYYLGRNVKGPVTLDILDARGEVVRHYSTTDPEAPIPADKLIVPAYWQRPPMNLSTKAGEHRFLWDMHYDPIPGVTPELDSDQVVMHDTPRKATSPWVMPGRYTVRLTVDGHSYSQPLKVRMDPRVRTSITDLKKQFTLAKHAYDETMVGVKALGQIRNVQRQLKSRKKQSPSVVAYEKKLQAIAGPESAGPFYFYFHKGTPIISGTTFKLMRLMGEIENADRAPTKAQGVAVEKTVQSMRILLKRWEKLKGKPLARLNIRLRALKLPPVAVLANAPAPKGWDEPYWVTENADRG